MVNSPLLIKSKQLALDIVRLCEGIRKTKHEYSLSDQLLRSGTSVGANIREAFYGSSRADFVSKLQIALKECFETEYWLEILTETGYCDGSVIIVSCAELKKLLTASINTTKKRMDNG